MEGGEEGVVLSRWGRRGLAVSLWEYSYEMRELVRKRRAEGKRVDLLFTGVGVCHGCGESERDEV